MLAYYLFDVDAIVFFGLSNARYCFIVMKVPLKPNQPISGLIVSFDFPLFDTIMKCRIAVSNPDYPVKTCSMLIKELGRNLCAKICANSFTDRKDQTAVTLIKHDCALECALPSINSLYRANSKQSSAAQRLVDIKSTP